MSVLYLRNKDGEFTRVKTVKGDPGKDGKSAYEYAKDFGYTGTEEEFAELMANGVSEEDIQDAVEKYLEENPPSGGGVDFEIDSTLKLKDGILSVNTTNDMEQDNTLPITSAGVFATVGNIEALLKTI